MKLIRLLSVAVLLSLMFPPQLPTFQPGELRETIGYVYRMTRV